MILDLFCLAPRLLREVVFFWFYWIVPTKSVKSVPRYFVFFLANMNCCVPSLRWLGLLMGGKKKMMKNFSFLLFSTFFYSRFFWVQSPFLTIIVLFFLHKNVYFQNSILEEQFSHLWDVTFFGFSFFPLNHLFFVGKNSQKEENHPY